LPILHIVNVGETLGIFYAFHTVNVGDFPKLPWRLSITLVQILLNLDLLSPLAEVSFVLSLMLSLIGDK